MKKEEQYIPDYPWSLIKSYLLTFNRNRVTKSARIMKEYCEAYEQLRADDEIAWDTSFAFVYFYSMMKYRENWDYALLPPALDQEE